MSPHELLAHYGTQRRIANAAGIAQSSVAEWFSNGAVPEVRQYQFEVLSDGKLRAERPVSKETA